MTDKFLWVQVQMNSYSRNWNIPYKAWLSQLVNFKNPIWTWGHFRRRICYNILFQTWKKCHRNAWNASHCFWSILHESGISFSVAFFPSLKQNFIAYRSSKVSDCLFEIHQLWQSGFSRVYSNCCCSCSFKPEIIKIGRPSHKIYSNDILNF